jgi:diacylglycerol kinase (ATP)
VLIGNPTSVVDWAKVASGLLGGAEVEPLEYGQGKKVVIESVEPIPYQLDGDAEGDTNRLEAEAVPAGLMVMLQRTTADRRVAAPAEAPQRDRAAVSG